MHAELKQSELKEAIEWLREVGAKATPRPWRSFRDGNQFVETRYMPTAKCVGASRIPELVRPWNPHALLAFGFRPQEYETARFTDGDSDFIVEAANTQRALLALVVAQADCLYAMSTGTQLAGAWEAMERAQEAFLAAVQSPTKGHPSTDGTEGGHL